MRHGGRRHRDGRAEEVATGDGSAGDGAAVVLLPRSAEGHSLYSCIEAMNIIACFRSDGSAPISAVKREMIRQKLVPVHKTLPERYIRKYVGSEKPDPPVHWHGRWRKISKFNIVYSF